MTVTPAGAPYRPAYIRAANGLYYRVGVSTSMDAPTAHGALSGLGNDDHPQYLLPSEVVAGTNITVDRTTTPGSVIITGTSTAGVTAHGLLTGLANDDHPQYHDDTRGDVRYLKRNVNETTTGSITGLHFALLNVVGNGTSASHSLIRFDVTGNLHRWAVGRGQQAEDTDIDGTPYGSDFIIYRYNNRGALIDAPFSIKRDTGQVLIYNGTGVVATLDDVYGYLPTSVISITPKAPFVEYSSGWASPTVVGTGRTYNLVGMFKVNANLNVTAGTAYQLGTVEQVPKVLFINGSGVYSLNGTNAGSIPCVLRIGSTGILDFTPTTSGTLTTNGWVSINGSYWI